MNLRAQLEARLRPEPVLADFQDPITAAEARQMLGISQRTLQRRVQAGALSVALDRWSGEKIYDRVQVGYLVQDMEATREAAEEARKTCKAAAQRAVWALRAAHPKEYEQLLAKELLTAEQAARARGDLSRSNVNVQEGHRS